ncbi:hypothetical protein GALMADRAFT_1354768 [Galerina marginata CBS 339.88]|uniref:Fungal-type protein kinase domain-containing protein n=1 Tax=Galerina marginata (strain CBS 339.88) TaxID=685588 RepID=A0A067SBN9_GALM3|nr:hypothetical protein GALMADRAFT_1354766 [Galerina marginata CBS 339.88]KDR68288.1 hypothetical protein GALMADRAFT_1354768 [Galerina marginata CBS 339.88]
MPFLTDATWPIGLIRIFEVCRRDLPPGDNRYYGPYHKLLAYCFTPDSFEYFVAPYNPLSASSSNTIDSSEFLVVYETRRRPILIVDIKDDSWADRADLRLKADTRMRQAYDSILADCPVHRLWGLSLLGTSLRVYCGDVDSGALQPGFANRPSRSHTMPRDFLAGCWDIDILSQEGFDQVQAIVEGIFAMLQIGAFIDFAGMPPST